MDNKTLLGRMAIFVGTLLLVAVIVVGAIIVLRNSQPEVQIVEQQGQTQTVVETTEVDVPAPQNKDSGDRIQIVPFTGCRYAEGWDSKGLTVDAGTVVTGPAVIKPDRDISWGVPVYVGETYTTTRPDEVVWVLDGNDACVDSQRGDEEALHFQHWGQTHPFDN